MSKIALFLSSNNAQQVSSNGSVATYEISPSINLNPQRNYYLKLKDCAIPYVSPNITATSYNKFSFNYENVLYEFTLPVGLYTIESIQMFINNSIDTTLQSNTNLLLIEPNTATGQIVMTCTTKITNFNFTMDNSQGSNVFGILGFATNQTFGASYAGISITSSNQAMLNVLETLYIGLDIVSTSCIGNGYRSICESIVPNVAPYSTISMSQKFNLMETLVNRSQIDAVTVSLYDQNFNIIDLRGEIFSVTIQIEVDK